MAELAYESYETPWITVGVDAWPALLPFLPYFADPDLWPEDNPAFDAMVAEVHRRGRFRLFDDAGLEVAGFSLVNLDGTGANLRY